LIWASKANGRIGAWNTSRAIALLSPQVWCERHGEASKKTRAECI